MVILTSVIAGRVYGLSLKDLPLDRLSEQKHKKRRHQLGSKNKLNDIDRTKVVPSPSVQESKPEVTSSSAAPVTVIPSTVKTVEPAKNEANAAFVTENQDKQIPGTSLKHLTFLNSFPQKFSTTVDQGRKKEFLPGSTTWRKKFPADQRSIFVLNMHVHKHIVFYLTMVLNSKNNVCQPYVVAPIVGHGC